MPCRRPWSVPAGTGRCIRGAAAFCALAGFTGAVPAGLIHYAGWPLPRQVPGWAQVHAALMTPLTETALLKVVACAFWLAWLMFALCLTAEIIASVRACPAPRLPGMAPAQALAATLVSALTFTATVPAATAALAAVPAAAALAAAPRTAPQVTTLLVRAAAPAQPAPAEGAAPRRGRGREDPPGGPGRQPVGHRPGGAG